MSQYQVHWQRADRLLVDRQLVDSRTRAQRLIAAGHVSLRVAGQWQPVQKPSEKLSSDVELQVQTPSEERFVSRGALKLAGALARLDVRVEGQVALDIGQSTGGFTDLLLQQGAAQVVGVDVGHEQLALSLRADPRVVCLEGINARALPAEQLLAYSPGGYPLVVMDVSFISQTLILPNLAPLLAPGGVLVSLVKPQFEVGPAGIGKGGIVRDSRLFGQVENRLREQCRELKLAVRAYIDSPITGTDGNREFFICVSAPSE